MKKLHLATLATLASMLLAACGDDDDDKSNKGNQNAVDPPVETPTDAGDGVTRTITEPASPVGTVSGQVLDTDLVPLVGASVELMVGSQTAPRAATVDDKGFFAFPGVPAGAQVLLSFTKPGYATLRATSTVPSSAGNVPINNGNASFGPVLLAKLDGTIRFRVALPSSQPAVGAVGTLRARPAGTVILSNGDNTTSSISVVTVTAVADANGVLEFKNIPAAATLTRYQAQNAQYQLTITPIDQNADGVYETGGFVNAYTPAAILQAGNLSVLNLPAPQLAP